MRRALQAATALVVLLVLAGPALAEAAGVQVEVDRRSMTTDDDLNVEIRLSGDFDDYAEPTMEGFEVAARSQQQSIQIVNGRMSRQQVLSLRLVARRTGTLTIGSVVLSRGGRPVARSEPVQVQVREPATQPPVSADRAQDLARNAGLPLFLQAETPRTHYYVGEPFSLAWNLYFQPQVQVTGAEIVNKPALQGLLAEELMGPDDQLRVREKVIGGRTYRYVMRSLQLATGLEAGTATIDPMALRVAVGDVFRRGAQTVRSTPFNLEIRPVPTEGRPKWFQEGNVGRFGLSGSLLDAAGTEPKTVQTGERLILDVTISGSGALLSVKAPEVDGGDAFDVQPLPASGEDDIQKDVSGMHGKRVFQFILVPRKPGKQKTPTVHFAWFDPTAEQFKELAWEGREIEVTGRAMASESQTAALAGEDIEPIIEGHTLRRDERLQLLGTPLLWALILLPLAGWLGTEITWRLRARAAKDPAKRRSRGAHKNARMRLGLAREAMKAGLVKDFYGHLSRTLTSYFEERANVPAMGLTHDELREAAGRAGYPADLLEAVIVELENCDFARFAPAGSADAQMREAAARAQELLGRLDRVEPRRLP
ncbi:MAG: protein BatD [Deltaproteobacteria bacterium]|nr:protein BatD [Deltaproteobacteria bacterium]